MVSKLMFDCGARFGCFRTRENDREFRFVRGAELSCTKFFNTFEGGAIITNDDELAEKMRLMRNFGFPGSTT